MRFAFVENGSITQYPIGLVDIGRKFPNTSFPADWQNADLSSFGVVKVEPAPSPSVDVRLQKVEEGAPVELDGVWTQAWEIIDLTPAEIEAATATEAAQVRGHRNELLLASDWTQLADAPLDADAKLAWQLYRETLRLVPAQPGFPWDVQWPPVPGDN